jgi:hypothetical protein
MCRGLADATRMVLSFDVSDPMVAVTNRRHPTQKIDL